ncbi:hypothetical protein B0T41_18650 [Chromobacterium violaceum]|nr:hypothetical protein B0T41_18650 [Chromobacterium violaceum]
MGQHLNIRMGEKNGGFTEKFIVKMALPLKIDYVGISGGLMVSNTQKNPFLVIVSKSSRMNSHH